MTDTDRIAQMAREAGLDESAEGFFLLSGEDLARFARLVAEDCAKLSESHKWWEDAPELHRGPDDQNLSIAQAIRARYSKP